MRTRDEFWAPPSARGTNDTGLTALAWTSILLFTVLGARDAPGLARLPAMDDPVAAALLMTVRTIPLVVIWDGSR